MFDPDWAPSVSDIGEMLRARTKDTNGNERGTFTPETRPTDDQVTGLIDRAVARVSSRTGTVPDQLQDAARSVATLAAACLVELSFFPEQINADRSPYRELKALYDEELTQLIADVGEVTSGDDLGSGDDPALPVGSFPDATNAIGWQTQW
jgi:hypothetical protein